MVDIGLDPDPERLQRKKYAAQMESIDQRIQGVKAFLELFKPNLSVSVIPIYDGKMNH